MGKNKIELSIHKRKRKVLAIKTLLVLGGMMILLMLAAWFYEPEKPFEAKAIRPDHSKVVEEKQIRADRLLEQLEEEGAPEGLSSTLRKNNETLNFVMDYDKRNHDFSSGTQISEESTTIPLLLQWDERWGYAPYGTSMISSAGCGPTCLAMVVSYFTKDETITPYTMAQYSIENGHVTDEGATYCALMESTEEWNIHVVSEDPDEKIVEEALKAGNPIICNVFPGDFTETGHFIVLTGYADGMVSVNDPFSRRNSLKLWRFADIQDQIDRMWIYSQ